MRFSRHLPRLLTLSALLLGASARAQFLPAEDFFNRGAQAYISNNIPAALSQVEMGLKTYPDDGKLKKLEELLKQKQQQQQQQQQNQQNQKQQDQSQSQKSDDKKSQSQKDQSQSKPDQKNQADQKKPDDEQKQPQGQKPEDKKPEGDKPQPEKPDDNKNDKDGKDGDAQPVAAGQMKPEEAKRLLDAQKSNEQVLQMKPQGKPQDPLHPVKDW
ncbi:MAG TPA: hypothetical protein VGO57_16100 [Verrucomicrobiae bacterium]|jgi:Ca-activated chloride channel family protein